MCSGAVIPLLKGNIPDFWKERSSGTSQATLLLLNFSDQVLFRSIVYNFWQNNCHCLLLPQLCMCSLCRRGQLLQPCCQSSELSGVNSSVPVPHTQCTHNAPCLPLHQQQHCAGPVHSQDLHWFIVDFRSC